MAGSGGGAASNRASGSGAVRSTLPLWSTAVLSPLSPFVEIGPVPARDRSSSVPRSVRRRGVRDPGPRAGHSCTTPTDDDAGLAPKYRPRQDEAVPQQDSFPHERRAARRWAARDRHRAPLQAPSRAPHGPRRTPGPTTTHPRHRGIVPRSTRSYPAPRSRTLKPPQGTTRHRSVRPRGPMYDHTSPGTTPHRSVRPREPMYDHTSPGTETRPHDAEHNHTSNGTTTQPLPPHQAPPDPSPTTTNHKPHNTPDRQPPPTTNPLAHHLTTQPRHTNRTRAGTEPISVKETTERGARGWLAGGSPAARRELDPPRCQASLTSSSMSSTLFMSRKRDTCRRASIPRRGPQELGEQS